MAKLVSFILSVVIALPIWFYLMYQILVRVQASELMWFLFWVYVPVTILSFAVAKMIEGK